MDAKAILQMMEDYLASTFPDEDLSNLASQPVSAVLTSSLDMVEFVMHLEEKLELDEDIDLDELGPKFAQNITFAQLAQEAVGYLDEG